MKSTVRIPFSQNDDCWADELMWDRKKVIKAHMKGNGASEKEAKELLHVYKDDKGKAIGNTIRTEGCMLTSLAMVLRLLDKGRERPAWTPKLLNDEAHERHFYTLAGLSMVPLYADLVSEVTQGEVQLCAKEDYFPGEPAWPRNYASTSLLVRAYRRLSKVDRSHFAVMLKIGTYDDTFASHYLLLDPSHPGDPDDDDVAVLDPAMPEGKKLPWHLGKSAKCLCEDPDIKEAWKKANIEPLQIGGVWLFARWRTRNDPLLLGPMVEILASEMKSKR